MGINDTKLNEKIAEFEEELRTTKYNKRTQRSVGLLKAKIARLRDERQKKATAKIATDGFAVKKAGDATAALIGFPSAGKSTLLNKITDAESRVGAYAFTTLKVIPGVLNYKKTRIQILDVPGLIEGASEGKGRGKEVLAAASSADLIILLVDAAAPEQLQVMKNELYEARIRMNMKKPEIRITKKPTGGLNISCGSLTKMDKATVIAILHELRVNNADVVIRGDITPDELIDVVEGNRVYVPGIIILTKIDSVDNAALEKAKAMIKPDLCISAEKGIGLDELKELIFRSLKFVRIYCKEAGKNADMNEPMVLHEGATLKDVCERLHRDFVKRFKFARIWGKSVKFDGQKVLKLDNKVADEDIVEVHVD